MPADSHERRADIQGLRAIAVLMVVAYHTGLPIPGGFAGVDVFFVISGFVISRLLLRELAQTDRLQLSRFYARRVRRLGPALAAMLIVVGLCSLVLENPLGSQQLTAKMGVAAANFTANVMLFEVSGGYFDAPSAFNPLLHTWTLAVEEQFYLFFPLLLLLAWRSGGRRRRAMLAILGVLVLSFLLCVLVMASSGAPFGAAHINSRFAFFASPTRAWEFAAGAVLALLELRSVIGSGRVGVAHVLTWGGIAGVAATTFLLNDQMSFPGWAALLPVGSTALIIQGGLLAPNGGSRLLGKRVLTWIGDRSYGWYLWHWPLIVFARVLEPEPSTVLLVAVGATALVPAAWSFRLLEAPVRRDARRMGRRRTVVLALACSLLPTSVFGVLFLFTRTPAAPFVAIQRQYMPHADLARGCTANLPEDATTLLSCTWSPPGTFRGTILLVGDSNAGQFAEPVIRAANDRGYRAILATYGGCPFADVKTRYHPPQGDPECRRFIEHWTNWVATHRPDAVVLANASSRYLGSAALTMEDPHGGAIATNTSDKRAVWQGGLTRTLRLWSDSHVPIVLVETVPQFKNFDLRLCPAFRVIRHACGRRIARSFAEEQQATARKAEEAAAASFTTVRVLNLNEQICSLTFCATDRDGVFLYRDGGHLTVGFSVTLQPLFGGALDSVLNVAGSKG